MTEKLYDHIDELVELEQKIRTKQKFEMGDPNVIRYNQLRASFIKEFMPRTEDDFIEFVKDIKYSYERWLEGGIEEVREQLEPKLKEANERLRTIAEQVQPYLKKEDF